MTDIAPKEKPFPQVPALILCGGRSRRMGQNKAFLPLGTGTLLQRVQQAFSRHCDQTVLVIGHDATMPKQHGFGHVIRDETPDLGPLEGLRAGLSFLRDHEIVLVGTCDAPLIVGSIYDLLLAKLVRSPESKIALPVFDGQSYPLTAAYRTAALAELTAMVEADELRVKDLLKRVPCVEISRKEFQDLDPELSTIRNINTRQEYQQLLHEFDAGKHLSVQNKIE